jgi:hypothetical protein
LTLTIEAFRAKNPRAGSNIAHDGRSYVAAGFGAVVAEEIQRGFLILINDRGLRTGL